MLIITSRLVGSVVYTGGTIGLCVGSVGLCRPKNVYCPWKGLGTEVGSVWALLFTPAERILETPEAHPPPPNPARCPTAVRRPPPFGVRVYQFYLIICASQQVRHEPAFLTESALPNSPYKQGRVPARPAASNRANKGARGRSLTPQPHAAPPSRTRPPPPPSLTQSQQPHPARDDKHVKKAEMTNT
jgi:hypothetical protein